MTNSLSIETVASRANALRALHAQSRILVLPNAWDAASARVFEAAGFPATATTSGGVAAALGYEDHEGAPAEAMLAAATRMTNSVAIPVTVDFEAGYGLDAGEVARRLIQAGAAGFNLEDTDHRGQTKLVEAEKQAERLAAIKSAAHAEGVELFLNARVDVFIQRIGPSEDQLAEGLRRARLYREAGADCIYPILLSDESMIAQFVKAVGVINLNLRRGGPLSLADAAALGVRRVTYATSLFREMRTALEEIAASLRADTALVQTEMS
jgi:2-methylisocitrate lyase-like PEP mutase family enzyme